MSGGSYSGVIEHIGVASRDSLGTTVTCTKSVLSALVEVLSSHHLVHADSESVCEDVQDIDCDERDTNVFRETKIIGM